MNQQSTIDDLQQAWTRAIEAESIPGARSEYMYELQRLRDSKTTWVGKEENELRFALDRYLGRI